MKNERGVTLIEMLIVVSIAAVMVGIMFPSATTGIESVRLASAADTAASFLASAVNRAERRQVMVELTISRAENAIYMRYPPDFEKRLEIPDGLAIHAIFPEVPIDPAQPRRFLIYPGGAPPRIGIRIGNNKGAERLVTLDPVTGVPIVERVPNAK